ncbi:MAG: hypothetical protein ABSD70_04200 [Terracidiphilus sp.]|jgi:hypothetical protein
MTNATIRTGDVTASQKRQEHFAHANSGATVAERSTQRAHIEINGRDEWSQGIEEAWQHHLETLQQCVRELLHKNQQLRMALMAANEPERKYGDAGNF